MITLEKVNEYIKDSTLERNKYNQVNGFTRQKIFFFDEDFFLSFDGNECHICRRESREKELITEEEFFDYLDILIEMDLLRQKRINLRKMLINKDIREFTRDKKLKKIGI